MQYGIKETKEVLVFGLDLAKAIKGALEDKQLDFSDLPRLFPAFMKSGDALEGLDQIKNELADLSTDEVEQLKQVMRPYLGEIASPDVIKAVSDTLNAVESWAIVFDLVQS